jgi:hypothetical protein
LRASAGRALGRCVIQTMNGNRLDRALALCDSARAHRVVSPWLGIAEVIRSGERIRRVED